MPPTPDGMSISMSPSPSRPSSTAETQAFLQLLRRKPPAKVDGVLHLLSDMSQGDVYNDEKRRIMATTDCGRRLANALVKCEGLKGTAKKEAELSKDPETAKQIIQEGRAKYIDCLSYVSCPARWKQYTQCWSDLTNLNLPQLDQLRANGGFDVICRNERHALERCVGNLVSCTVGASLLGEDLDNVETRTG